MNMQPHLPLTEPTFFILLVLASEPQHGYAIMKETAVLSDGRVQLNTSTLYGAIKRLLERGWIKRVEEEGTQKNDRIRKAYTLTHLGRRNLEAYIARKQTLVTAARHSTAGAHA